MESYDVLAVMRSRLAATGLYTADGTTLVDSELSAYAAGFQLVLDDYTELAREAMVQTAETYGITLREAVLGLALPHLTMETRRELLLARLAVGCNDCNVEAVERALQSVGVTAEITEQPEEGAITVTVTGASQVQPRTQAALKERMALFLPAHLLVNYDFSQVPNFT